MIFYFGAFGILLEIPGGNPTKEICHEQRILKLFIRDIQKRQFRVLTRNIKKTKENQAQCIGLGVLRKEFTVF